MRYGWAPPDAKPELDIIIIIIIFTSSHYIYYYYYCKKYCLNREPRPWSVFFKQSFCTFVLQKYTLHLFLEQIQIYLAV